MINISDEIKNALAVLKKGGTILYPTETVWGIGCDATNAAAVDKVYKIKRRNEEKALICLVSNFNMLNQYIEDVPKVAYEILKCAVKPTTVIYDKPIGVAENLIGKDNTLGIRVTRDDFCQELIRRLKRPLVSTSANISGQETPLTFAQIPPEILEGVDYVVNLQQSMKTPKPSAVIKLSNDGNVKVIRK